MMNANYCNWQIVIYIAYMDINLLDNKSITTYS